MKSYWLVETLTGAHIVMRGSWEQIKARAGIILTGPFETFEEAYTSIDR